MRLRRLDIHRLPGIHHGFSLDGLSSGVNVIVGPNASGKTSVIRAIRALLYPAEQRDPTVNVEGVFEDESGQLAATRTGNDHRWSRSGQPTDTPQLPDYRFLPCYVLELEYLLGFGATDTEIAARIALELAGGYDLRAVLDSQPFSLKTNHAKAEAKRLREADTSLRKREEEHRLLAEEETSLDQLNQKKKAAEEAGRQAARYQSALALLRARRHRRMIEQQLSEYPERMDCLQGNELETLERIRSQQAQCLGRRSAAHRHLRDAGAMIRCTGLSGFHLDRAGVGQARIQAQKLLHLESRCEQFAGDVRRAQTAMDIAVRGLGGTESREVQLEPAAVSKVEARLSGKRRLEAAITLLETELARLPDEHGINARWDQLKAARRELLAWLAAPRADGRPTLATAVFCVGAAVVASVIVAAGLRIHPACLLSLIPLATVVYARFKPAGRGRRQAQERFARTRIKSPAVWDEAGVSSRLEQVEQDVLEAGRLAASATRREEVARELGIQRTALGLELDALTQLARDVGFHPETLDASFERWVRLVSDYNTARGNRETAAKELRHHSDAAAVLRGSLTEFLLGHGEAIDTREPDAETVLAGLERLDGKLASYQQGMRDLDAARKDVRACAAETRRCDLQLRELFRDRGLEAGQGEGELRRRFAVLGAWRQRREEYQRAHWAAVECARELEDRPDLVELVEAEDEAALTRAATDLGERAAVRDDIVGELARIEDRLDRARRARVLEQARADRQSAEDELRDRLDSALFACTGRFLLEQVEAEYVEASRPAALRRAEEWFERFTRHQYGLIFDRDAGFFAREHATGMRRALTELSGGTRAQLLLAVRVAFALEAERGRQSLPLFLDEALATSDCERFAAVVDSLRLIADSEGRQVFYLATRPQDAGFWGGEPPDDSVRLIDLASVRFGSRTPVTDPGLLTIPAPAVPDPNGCSAEDYGVMIGVDAIEPWSDPSTIHIFHLFRDDLDFARRLLAVGIERVGPLRSLSRSDNPLLSGEERLRALARIAGAEAWIDGWREGRGRPLNRSIIEASGAVSARFVAPILALAGRVGWDAGCLLDEMKGGAIARFRTERLELFGQHLQSRGCLDERERLSAGELELRAQAAMAAVVRCPAEEDARSIAGSLLVGVEAGRTAACPAPHVDQTSG